MLSRILKITGYLVFSVAFGLFIAILVYYLSSISEEKQLRKAVKDEIKNTVLSFRESASNPTAEQTIMFLKKYCDAALSKKVVVIDASNGKAPGPEYATYLFTFSTGGKQADIYIKSAYVKGEVFDLEMPEAIEGIIATILVFTAFIAYEERKRQSLAIRQEYEVKHAELREAFAEHEALALLGRMTATLAHELKTPIATISNLVQVLPSRIADEKFTGRFVVLANEELNRTRQLIDNLLIYGKEISVNNEEWIALKPFILELAGKAGIAVKHCPEAEISGDRFYLRLVFENLVRNSLQASSGEITIKTGRTSGEVPFAEILYEDNGSGFPADVDLDGLISPFITNRSRGAGLGLYLVQKIAVAHGGTISLYRMAKGAGVRLFLPKERLRIYG